MKLDPECIRDIMCFVDDKQSTNLSITSTHMVSHFTGKYTLSELLYHVQRLIEAGYLNGKTDDEHDPEAFDKIHYESHMFLDGDPKTYRPHIWFTIDAIHWNGHEFLKNCRDNAVWNAAKEQLKSVGGQASIEIMTQICSALVRSGIHLIQQL